MRVATRRIVCRACGASTQEPIDFCPNPYVRYTKWTARFVLALRAEMSIKAVAEFESSAIVLRGTGLSPWW